MLKSLIRQFNKSFIKRCKNSNMFNLDPNCRTKYKMSVNSLYLRIHRINYICQLSIVALLLNDSFKNNKYYQIKLF